MKPLNRNRAFVALAVIEAIIVIPLLVLMGMGKMSTLTSVLSVFTVLFLTIVAGVYILYRFPADGAKRDVGFDPYSVPVERTRVSIIIEVGHFYRCWLGCRYCHAPFHRRGWRNPLPRNCQYDHVHLDHCVSRNRYAQAM